MDRTAEDLRQQIEMQREQVGHDLAAVGDRVTPSRIAGRGQARARRRFDNVKERVMGTAGSMSDSAGSSAHGMAESARHAPEALTERAEGNPLMAGAVAFGFGMLIGSLLPGTSKEQQLGRKVEPKLEQVAQGAAETARTVAADVRPTAEEEFGALKDEARGAAEATKTSATEHAQEAKEEVRP
jgi:ElaB/YqjD/DUF883 family membrane-anchored ribosome-binding protein